MNDILLRSVVQRLCSLCPWSVDALGSFAKEAFNSWPSNAESLHGIDQLLLEYEWCISPNMKDSLIKTHQKDCGLGADVLEEL